MHVVIADASAFQAHCVGELIQRFDVKHTFKTAVALSPLIKLCNKEQPDMIVMDSKMRDCQGEIGVRTILATFPDTPLLVFTSEDEDEFKVKGYTLVSKNDPMPEIRKAFQTVFGTVEKTSKNKDSVVETVKLSKRQKQLIICIRNGDNNREIAVSLGISEHTVKVHLWRLFKRLDVNSRSKALVKASSMGY